VLLRIALTLGFGCLISVLSVFIPDLKEMLGFLMTVWLFLTPIFYVPSAVPDWLQVLMQINPLYHLVNAYRTVLFSQPGIGFALLKAALSGGAILGFGLWFFRKTLTRARDLI
jgi:lipopolysaccharide transport system permease protein